MNGYNLGTDVSVVGKKMRCARSSNAKYVNMANMSEWK